MARRRPFPADTAPRLLRLPILLLLLCLPLAAHGQQLEQAVKAAFLPKFARYVSWPGGAGPAAAAPYQLCLMGQDPFGLLVNKAAAGETVGPHGVAIRRLGSIGQLDGCHIVYVQGSSAAATSAMLAAVGDRPMLTVTDDRGGPRRGLIHFTLSKGRVRFHIDNEAAARRRLVIDSRLLSLALSVKQRPS